MEQTFDFETEIQEEEVSFDVEPAPVPEVDVDTFSSTPEVEAKPVVGASIHQELSGRESPNQHPMSAISGLEEVLNRKQPIGDYATKTDLNGKQDTIEDLDEIRDGAEKGGTAVQPEELDEYATTQELTDGLATKQEKGNYATKEELNTKQDKGDYALKSEIPTVPTKVSAFENDKGYLTKHQDISNLATKEELVDGLNTKQEKGDYATKTELNGKQDTIEDLDEIRDGASKGSTAVQPTRKINNKPLSSDITLTNTDVGALPSTTKYGSSLSLTINNQTYILTAQLKDQNGDNLGTAQTIDLPLETMVVGAEYDETTKEIVLTLQNGESIRFSVADLVSGLQPTISDLAEIRQGAEKGNTAVQPSQLSTVATSGNYADLNGKPTIPTKTSQLINNSDFTTKAYVDGLVGDIETALNNINSGS